MLSISNHFYHLYPIINSEYLNKIMEYSEVCHFRLQSTNYKSTSEYVTLNIINKLFNISIIEYKS